METKNTTARSGLPEQNGKPWNTGKSRSTRLCGFTLVELIVVITILVILWTIAFLNLWGYSGNARDSSRVSDLTNLSKGLNISYIKTGYYPAPDSSFSVTYLGWILWDQWTVGDSVMKTIISWGGVGFSKKPTDPLTVTKEYVYSKLAFWNGYQIKADWEGDSVAFGEIPGFFGLGQASAASNWPNLAYIKGNYGGLVARTLTGGVNYVLAMPSIMTSTGTVGTPLKIESNELSGVLLLHGKKLISPSTFNPTTVVFSGASLPKDDKAWAITAIMTALQTAYTFSGSDLSAVSSVATLLNITPDKLAAMGNSVMGDQLGVAVSTGGGTSATCGTGTQLGYAFTPIANGQSQTATKTITNGTGWLTATCNNGILSYGAETAQSCTVGLPMGNACTCPTGATCETNGMKYVTAWTYTFSISGSLSVGAVAVWGGGGGGYQWSSGWGGGGWLGWKNGIALSPNTTYTVVVGVGGTSMANAYNPGSEGGNSYFVDTSTVVGYGGGRGGAGSTASTNAYGGGYLGDGGGRGGNGAYNGAWNYGWAGAGGYSGAGADSTNGASTGGAAAPAGGGGGSGGWYSSTWGVPAGGGVGLYGQGTSGSTTGDYSSGGRGGSGGGNGQPGEPQSNWWASQSITGGFPGGGWGGSGTSAGGGKGGGWAVRIIWGAGRSFPNSAS